MKLFFAGLNEVYKKLEFYDFYKLDSFFYIKDKKINIHKYKDFIIDSGAFTIFKNKNSDIDWDKYIYDYANYIIDNNIKNYIELDIDRIIGYDLVLKLRANLEKKIGYKSMPVWHINRGKDEWIKLCKEYEYICCENNLLRLEKGTQILKNFMSIAKQNNTKIHGLGITNMKHIKTFNFYSVDSTTWLSGRRFGGVFYFILDGKNSRIIRRNPPSGFRTRSDFNIDVHNFYEWLKLAQWADRNL